MGSRKVNKKERVEQIQSNNEQIQECDANIAKAEMEYNRILKEERRKQLAIHAANVCMYSKKSYREKIIKKGKKYCYPDAELAKLKSISNRDIFDADSISRDDIIKFQELDFFVLDHENNAQQYERKDFSTRMILADEDGGEKSDS